MKHVCAKLTWVLCIVGLVAGIGFFTFLAAELTAFGRKVLLAPIIFIDGSMIVGLILTLHHGWRMPCGVPPEPMAAPLLPQGPPETELGPV